MRIRNRAVVVDWSFVLFVCVWLVGRTREQRTEDNTGVNEFIRELLFCKTSFRHG